MVFANCGKNYHTMQYFVLFDISMVIALLF